MKEVKKIQGLIQELSAFVKLDQGSKLSLFRYGNIQNEDLEKLRATFRRLIPARQGSPARVQNTLPKRELPHTAILRRWQAVPFYQKLNEKIKDCIFCEGDKIGFIPNFGMNYVDAGKAGLEGFESDLLIIADPPLNFFVKGALPPSPRACFVSGLDTNGKIGDLLANENAVSSTKLLFKSYPRYVTEAPSLFLEEINNAGLRLDRIILSSIGRCFITKKRYKEAFGDNSKKGLACKDWLPDEIDFLIKSSRPKGILSFSTHFTRFFMDLDLSMENLRLQEKLKYQGTPFFATYHPYLWTKDSRKREDAREDLDKLRNEIFH